MADEERTGGIGEMGEHSLHAALKKWYALPDDRFEVELDGYIIDIVREGLLIEIQTGNFGSMRRKLKDLLEKHRIRLVHPIPRERWIVHLAPDGMTKIDRRKSPKHWGLVHLFREMVSIPHIMPHPNFELEILVIQEEAIRRQVGTTRTGRRRYKPFDRRLISVEGRRRYKTPAELKRFIPEHMDQPFTNADLAKAAGLRRGLAEKMTYCLRKMNAIEVVGKRGGARLYRT